MQALLSQSVLIAFLWVKMVSGDKLNLDTSISLFSPFLFDFFLQESGEWWSNSCTTSIPHLLNLIVKRHYLFLLLEKLTLQYFIFIVEILDF